MSNPTFTIQANQAWQPAGTIPANTQFLIHYASGLWTADPATNNGKQYDANGCPNLPVAATKTSYPIQGVNEGSLVGRINGGTPFYIGASPYFLYLSTQGTLELCINDDLTGQYGAGLTDNTGAIVVEVGAYANTQPDFSKPLVQDPTQTNPGVPTSFLGPLQHFIGTWTNQNYPGTNAGGPLNPFSYNVMPLPQSSAQPQSPYGYILKNFTYYEELTFTSIHGNAPNRDGSGQQICYTLFYEQRVYFAEGPNKDALVHAENGSLLFILDGPQPLGPYGNNDMPGVGSQTVQPATVPTTAYRLVKQVSVPHGNSILALGKYDLNTPATGTNGLPQILPASTLPTGIDPSVYSKLDPVSNPQPDLTLNPNLALTNALVAKPCTNFIQLDLSTTNDSGTVANIAFEQKFSNVKQYSCTYWLESFDNSTNFTQLQYSQNITLQLNLGGKVVTFPHITVNTLTKVKTS